MFGLRTISLTQKSGAVASRTDMDGIPPGHERQAVRQFYRRLFATGVILFLPYVGSAQTANPSGLQASAASPVHFEILDQKSVWVGNHSITLNRVSPPVFPPAAGTPAPAPPPPVYANYVALTFWATVYDGKFTVLRWSIGDQSMVAVSNIDFDYLGTLGGFAEGNTFYEIIAFLDNESSQDADPQDAAWLRQAQNSLQPAIPGYVIVSGTASPDELQGLDAAHLYFGANRIPLIQAYTLRQAEFAAEQLHLKLYPPVRPATVINYWPIKSSVYPTGAAQ
jgi:hypothetical protein